MKATSLTMARTVIVSSNEAHQLRESGVIYHRVVDRGAIGTSCPSLPNDRGARRAPSLRLGLV